MKNKGFTFIEIIVATTLLLLLSELATTTAYHFMQAATNLKSQFENLRDGINGLYATVSLAKITYEADSNFAIALGLNNNPINDPNVQAAYNEARKELDYWNSSAGQSNPANLINVLLNPNPLIKKSPGGYLPAFNTVQVWRNDNGNMVLDTETPSITDYNSLLRAFLLTDKRTPDATDPIVAALTTLGMILDVGSKPQISPTLPQIVWRRGTTQQILFPI